MIGIKPFDVMIGMDSQSGNRAETLCTKKRISILLAEGRHVILGGQKSLGSNPIISVMRAQSAL